MIVLTGLTCESHKARMAKVVNLTNLNFAILSIKEMLKFLGISRSTLYRLIKSDPTFPNQIKLGARRVGFRDTDLKDWVDSQNPVSDPEPQGA